LVNQVKALKPDLVISHGGTHGLLARLGVASAQLFSAEGSFFGYSGYFSLLRRLAISLKHRTFAERLSQKVQLPYKESWYERDTFSYIKTE
jgi:nitrogenase molybdenum-iron protein alpha chain